MVTDKNVLNIIEIFKKRSEDGVKKYGMTTDQADLGTLQWLVHLQEELMDAVIYIERLKNEEKTI